jgi:uncharacterized protein with beta-barrel porin domain
MLMTLRLRRLLLASAAPALGLSAALPGAAHAVDLSNRSTPVDTSTVDNGNPGDINVPSGITVTLPSNAPVPVAVTVNSNNSVTNGGTIHITDANNAVGIHVLGSFTGTVTNSGTITLDESYVRAKDSNNVLIGPFAQGENRTGILIEGAAPFAGDIINSGTISVNGNDSFGINQKTALSGCTATADGPGGCSLVHTGSTTMVGDRSVGINLAGDVQGDVRIKGSIIATGEGAKGVVVGGHVGTTPAGGTVYVGGEIESTGFTYPTVSNYFDPHNVPSGFTPPPIVADDLKNGGAALTIAGSVTNGVLIDGPVGGGDAATDGTFPNGRDVKGDWDNERSPGSVSAIGSAPAVLITPDLSAAQAGDLVIGLVVESVRDPLDINANGDTNDIVATFLETHGLVNRGTIAANGLNIGYSANAITISGSADGTRKTIVQGGILNVGAISANAYEADATTVHLGSGAVVPHYDNTGVTSAVVTSAATDPVTGKLIDRATQQPVVRNVTVMLIDAGSMLNAIDNSGTILAQSKSHLDDNNLVAIRDLSGTLVKIDNSGQILTTYSPLLATDPTTRGSGEHIAMDLRAIPAGPGVVITQQWQTPTKDNNGDGVIDRNDVPTPTIAGDILLGAGDDDIEVHGGVVAGDISFGSGQDKFTIDGGSTYTGAITDSDGQLAMSIGDATVTLTSRQDLRVSSLNLGDGSITSFSVDLRPQSPSNPAGPTNTKIVSSGGVTIGNTAQITPQFFGLGPVGQPQDVTIITAPTGGITLADGHSIAQNLAAATPFLYQSALETKSDGSTDTVVVTVRRKTAQDLGMTPNQAAAYEPTVAMLNTDQSLLDEVVNLSSPTTFFPAYNQLLPEFDVAVLQHGVANVDGTLGAVSNRLDAVRGGRSGQGAVWVQEYALYMDRQATPNDPGYRGDGFGLAAGIDRPFGPFYAAGLSFTGSASNIKQPSGFDLPLAISSGQIGAYAASSLGNLLFDFYAGYGLDFMQSDRRIVVGAVSQDATANWKGQNASASARLAYDFRAGRLFIRPSLSADYLQTNEDAYTEAGPTGLHVFSRDASVVSGTAALAIGGEFGDPQRTWWSPRVRVGYRYENYGHALLTTAQYTAGGDPFNQRADDLPPTGALVGFTFAAGSRYSSFAFDYNADLRDGFTRHVAEFTFRFIF